MTKKEEKIQAAQVKKLTMERIQAEKNYQKARIPKRFFAAVAVAAMLTVIAFAANIGSFDRVRDAVSTADSEEIATLIHPIEPIERKRGETIEGSTLIGEHFIDGIRIEAVAVGVFSNMIDVYTIFEDTTGNRLDGEVAADVRVGCVYNDTRGIPDTGIAFQSEVIHREDGMVILRDRSYFTQPVASSELSFYMRDLKYNMVFADGSCDEGIIGWISWDEMPLEWEFNFSVEIEEKVLSIDEINVQLYDDSFLNHVTITPFTVLLGITGEDAMRVNPRITINTTNGAFVRDANRDMAIFHNLYSDDAFDDEGYFIHSVDPVKPIGVRFLWILKNPTEFIDLDTVISIEVDGAIVELR